MNASHAQHLHCMTGTFSSISFLSWSNNSLRPQVGNLSSPVYRGASGNYGAAGHQETTHLTLLWASLGPGPSSPSTPDNQTHLPASGQVHVHGFQKLNLQDYRSGFKVSNDTKMWWGGVRIPAQMVHNESCSKHNDFKMEYAFRVCSHLCCLH